MRSRVDMLKMILLAAAVGSADHRLPEGEVIDTDRKVPAPSGDPGVALERFHRSMEIGDATNSAFWLRVAAEQGDCWAMVEYSRMLGAGMQHKDEQSLWLARARTLHCDLSRAVYHPKAREDE
jgi:hypothetical protein